MSRDLEYLVDHVALVYHEARNVRHLMHKKLLEPEGWKYLTALPTNRDKAWVALVKVRQHARVAGTAVKSLAVFEKRFHVSLDQLEGLYAHPAWRNSEVGGNAWKEVTRLVRAFAECLDHELQAEATSVREALAAARHNTGFVREKLARLENALMVQGAG